MTTMAAAGAAPRPPSSRPAVATTVAVGGGGGGGAEVSEEGIAFNPAEVTVSVGDTVTWTNNDSVGHDVTADSFSSGDAGGMSPGDNFEHTFDEAGSFDYVCTVHPGMEGTVVVE